MAINKGSANRVILVGNLGGDAEVHQTTDGTPVATLSLATNELWKDNDDKQQEHTEWHRVVLWRKQAEFAGQHLKKGRKIYVEGRLRTRTWEDKDGVCYVAEHNGGFFSVLTQDGELLARWGDEKFRSCHGAAGDSEGSIYFVQPVSGEGSTGRRIVKYLRKD